MYYEHSHYHYRRHDWRFAVSKSAQTTENRHHAATRGTDLVRDALKTHFARFPTHCISLEPRDSNLIDEAYRNTLWNVVTTSPQNVCLITHGTDRILDSAGFLHKKFEEHAAFKEKKKVILLGAMTPLANGPLSDGYLTLDFSLAKAAVCGLQNNVNIVLCAFDQQGEWVPGPYPYRPGRYEKYYDPNDGSRSRLRTLPEAMAVR